MYQWSISVLYSSGYLLNNCRLSLRRALQKWLQIMKSSLDERSFLFVIMIVYLYELHLADNVYLFH